jgi:acetolactate decarboxylase
MEKKSSVISCCQAGCGLPAAAQQPLEVRWQGAQRDVLAGDIRGHVPLQPLANLAHLYAIGPLAELLGEVTILHSEPAISRVVDDRQVQMAGGFDHGACFLVYAQVPCWREVSLPGGVTDLPALEAALPELAASAGLDPTTPFPFLLKGRPERIEAHILNKTDGLPHTPELHDRAKVHFSVAFSEAEIIGFHSESHRGIFTPGDSNLHLHVRTEDGTFAGHVEAMTLTGLQLYLPVT